MHRYISNSDLAQQLRSYAVRIPSEDKFIEYLERNETLFAEEPKKEESLLYEGQRLCKLVFIISDQGVGISKESIGKLFKMFVQVTNHS